MLQLVCSNTRRIRVGEFSDVIRIDGIYVIDAVSKKCHQEFLANLLLSCRNYCGNMRRIRVGEFSDVIRIDDVYVIDVVYKKCHQAFLVN